MEYAQNNSFVGPGHGKPTDDSSIRQKKTGSVPKPNTGINNAFLPNILEKNVGCDLKLCARYLWGNSFFKCRRTPSVT